jgi:hypothetical protein
MLWRGVTSDTADKFKTVTVDAAVEKHSSIFKTSMDFKADAKYRSIKK